MQTEKTFTEKTFVVTRNFHMGEIVINLSAGERLLYDGISLTRVSNTQKYMVKTFPLLLKSGLIVEDDGTLEFKSTLQAKPKQPTMKLLIEDQENLIVANIKLPEKEVKRENRTTEEVAKTTETKSSIIFDEQRVVGSAIRKSATERRILKEQGQDSVEVGKVKGAQEILDKSLEGLSYKGYNTISDTSDGVVVAKVKSYEERNAEIAKNAIEERKLLSTPVRVSDAEKLSLEEDTKLALAKRQAVKKAAAKPKIITADRETEEVITGVLTLDSTGLPKGFPKEDHWKKRLDWCKANRENVDALRLIYNKSTDSFKSQMNITFMDINLGTLGE